MHYSLKASQLYCQVVKSLHSSQLLRHRLFTGCCNCRTFVFMVRMLGTNKGWEEQHISFYMLLSPFFSPAIWKQCQQNHKRSWKMLIQQRHWHPTSLKVCGSYEMPTNWLWNRPGPKLANFVIWAEGWGMKLRRFKHPSLPPGWMRGMDQQCGRDLQWTL